MIKFLLSLVLLMFFTGCTKEVIKVKPVPTYYRLPKELLKPIPVPSFMSKKEYLSYSLENRELIQLSYQLDLYTVIGKYKILLNKIKKYDENVTRLTKDE